MTDRECTEALCEHNAADFDNVCVYHQETRDLRAVCIALAGFRQHVLDGRPEWRTCIDGAEEQLRRAMPDVDSWVEGLGV